MRALLTGTSPAPRRGYDVARTIPAGRVVTYGSVAERVGSGATAQAVGQALGANPVPLIVPCHRVIAAHGRLGGFSAPGGTAIKRRLLALENAGPDGPPELFDDAASVASGGTVSGASASAAGAVIEVSGRSLWMGASAPSTSSHFPSWAKGLRYSARRCLRTTGPRLSLRASAVSGTGARSEIRGDPSLW